MRTLMQKLLACCLLICLLLAPARAEMPSTPEERYATELSLLDGYLQNSEERAGLDIGAIRDIFLANGNIGEYAMPFMAYAEVLSFVEDGDFAGARAGIENLQSSDSFASFRAYLEDGEDLHSRGLYAIRPLDELEAYVHARECEAERRYTEAIGYYDQCQTFFDSYIRRIQVMRIAPTPTPTPMQTPSPTPTPAPTPAPSNILASRFVERFPNEYDVRTGTREVRFLATLRDAPADAIDVSQERDGSVQAWFEGDVLYIAANGVIYAPEDSSELFVFSFYDGSRYATSLEAIDFGGCFDTGNVSDMRSMFDGCSSLTELDISSFDTGNVTDMSWMFFDCSSLMELDVSGFDTGNVIDMSRMFYRCASLTELDVSGFDTGNVTDMSSIFSGCSSLTELNVSGFDTGDVFNMSSMFSDCSSLTELDVSGFDTGNVTNMSGMFDSCSNLTELDVSGFDTGNVIYMWSMFDSCSNLTELDVSGFDTGNVIYMSSMFDSCASLTELDVSGFDTTNVTDMSSMFFGCTSLTELDVNGFDTSNVTDMSWMFYACPAGQNVAASADSERPRLGITISTIDGPSAATPGAAPAGVRIEAIEEHGPAGNAGLQPYDVITEIAGERVYNNDQALEIIGRHSPGDFIELSVCRHFDANGELTEEYQEFTVEVRLEAFD